MVDDERGWLLRSHPYGYGLLAIVFALPLLYGLLVVWPDVASLPGVYPGGWRTVALFSTLISAGMALRSATPAAHLVGDGGRFTDEPVGLDESPYSTGYDDEHGR